VASSSPTSYEHYFYAQRPVARTHNLTLTLWPGLPDRHSARRNSVQRHLPCLLRAWRAVDDLPTAPIAWCIRVIKVVTPAAAPPPNTPTSAARWFAYTPAWASAGFTGGARQDIIRGGFLVSIRGATLGKKSLSLQDLQCATLWVEIAPVQPTSVAGAIPFLPGSVPWTSPAMAR